MRLKFLCITALKVLLARVYLSQALADANALPQDADIIFHTSTSSQSAAILSTTNSRFSHMGLIERVDGKYFVLESVATVKRTPLDRWKARGRNNKYAIYRLAGLTDAQRQKILAKAHTLEGLPYDIHFSAANNGKKEYCSKFVAEAYKGAELALGKWQKVRELATDNPDLQKLFKQRYKTHPLCNQAKISFEQCWSKVLDDTLITPEAIAKDLRMVLIDSNYD